MYSCLGDVYGADKVVRQRVNISLPGVYPEVDPCFYQPFLDHLITGLSCNSELALAGYNIYGALRPLCHSISSKHFVLDREKLPVKQMKQEAVVSFYL